MVPRQPRHRDERSFTGCRVMSQTWVALVRGINVGRAKRIAMLDLRKPARIARVLGGSHPRAERQCGLLVGTAQRRSDRGGDLEAHPQRLPRGRLRAGSQPRPSSSTAVDANPFVTRGVAPQELHVAFLSAEPAAAKKAALGQTAFSPDEFAFGKRVIYVRLPNGSWARRCPTGSVRSGCA